MHYKYKHLLLFIDGVQGAYNTRQYNFHEDIAVKSEEVECYSNNKTNEETVTSANTWEP